VLWECHGNPDQQWERSFGKVVNITGKCVGTALRGSMDNGTPLILWDCHGNPDQRWVLTPEGLLKNQVTPNRCVGLDNRGSTANGSALIVWDCHGNPDQRWSIPAP
jgi:alpha-galactosidase